MKRMSFTVSVDTPVYKRLEKRAKRELQTVPELAETLLRKSAANGQPTHTDKLDDKFIGLFSRKRRK